MGTSLVTELTRIALATGCWRIWVVTTNDNIDALRFYQRRGFQLVAMRSGAVDAARRSLKSSIP